MKTIQRERDAAAAIKTISCEMELYFAVDTGNSPPLLEQVVMSRNSENGKLLPAAEAAPSLGEVVSELEFAFRHIQCPVAAITGTNGKTTTTELTTALLKASAIRAESAGNIGHALSECAIEVMEDRVKFLVVEVSSFQIDTISRFPDCPAAILNIASIILTVTEAWKNMPQQSYGSSPTLMLRQKTGFSTPIGLRQKTVFSRRTFRLRPSPQWIPMRIFL